MSYLTYNGKYLRYGGKMLTTVYTPPPPPDEISVDPAYYVFTTAGGTEGVSVVTCSEAGISSSFTAAITEDTNNIIEELITVSGSSGDTIWLTCAVNSTQHTGCASATITLTCGDAQCDLIIYQDGTVEYC